MAKRKNADVDYQINGLNKKHKIDLNGTICDEDFVLTREIVENSILKDLSQKSWRVGKAIGKGSFGEIFLASDKTTKPVTSSNADYVVKIEPHSNGPLFVEIHCLLNTGKSTDDVPLPPGMPDYIASGSHYFGKTKYRFLILHRYECDLHSLIKNRRVDPKHVLIIASQIIDILEHFHDKGYAHSDIKAENLMIGSCKFVKNKSSAINSNRNSSDNKNHADYENMYNQKIYNNDDSKRKSGSQVEFSGSNPVRTCRVNGSLHSTIYAEMLKSHYLRPSKKINYDEELCDVFDDDLVLKRLYNSQNGINKKKEIRLTPRQGDLEKGREVTEDRIFLIDFGLASKFVDPSGKHRPFCMDQRRAHDGTLEFTSRDAHMGAHSRRSDLECLGYNLIYWCEGTLPWKDEKLLQQPEQVHHMKEYFMTDVDYMLRQIYGQNVPTFLAEFMLYVGNLAYDERPNYGFCKYIFEKAFTSYCKTNKNMILNISDLKQSCKKMKQIIPENNNLTNLKNIKSIMKLSMMLPFRDSNGSNKISPKNLRSKTDSKHKKGKKFSWTEILNTDPDQIARQRAEKEFERDQSQQTPITSKYTGRPTYAILEMEKKIKFKDRLDTKDTEVVHPEILDLQMKGYTKPMIDILKKRQSNQQLASPQKLKTIKEKTPPKQTLTITIHSSSSEAECGDNEVSPIRRRRHVGLRKFITPTKKSLHYNKLMRHKRKHKSSSTYNTSSNDETSCGSHLSTTDVCDIEVSDTKLNKFPSNVKTTATVVAVATDSIVKRKGRGRPRKIKTLTNDSIDDNFKERAFSRG